MPNEVAALLAAAGSSVLVFTHGVLGRGWLGAQRRSVTMQPSALWGDGDISWRLIGAVWHIVTATFAASATTLYLVGFEQLEGRELLRFIAIVHAAFLGVGLVYFIRRLEVFARPIFLVIVASLIDVSVFAFVAAS